MMSKATEEPLARLACRIADCANQNRSVIIAEALRSNSSSLESHWQTLRRQLRRVGKAVDHGWVLAARREVRGGRFDRDSWSSVWDNYRKAMEEFLRQSFDSLTAANTLACGSVPGEIECRRQQCTPSE